MQAGLNENTENIKETEDEDKEGNDVLESVKDVEKFCYSSSDNFRNANSCHAGKVF